MMLPINTSVFCPLFLHIIAIFDKKHIVRIKALNDVRLFHQNINQ